jgi:hypothetical protein
MSRIGSRDEVTCKKENHMSQTANSFDNRSMTPVSRGSTRSSRSRSSPSRTSTVQRLSTQGSGGGSTTTSLWETTFASSS